MPTTPAPPAPTPTWAPATLLLLLMGILGMTMRGTGPLLADYPVLACPVPFSSDLAFYRASYRFF